MKLSIAIFTACLLSTAFAASPKPAASAPPSHTSRNNPCNRPDTPSLTDCGNKAQEHAEQELNKTYQLALKTGDAAQQEELRQVQRVWLQYRDAECEIEGEGYSTLKVAMVALCVAALDKDRTNELKHDYLP